MAGSAVLPLDGGPRKRTLRTFESDIDVRVTAYQQVQSFIARNWQWLWAVIVAPLAAWIWKKKPWK